MWPRVVESMLAIWMLLSPFIIERSIYARHWVEILAGCLVAIFSMLSLHKRIQKIHLLNALIGTALFLIGYALTDQQNLSYGRVALGLLLIMFGILPSPAHMPPRKWRTYQT